MRHGAAGRRSRNRGGNGGRRGGGGGGNNRMQVFDSNGPDVRIRGTAYQIYEKYVALAKDAHGLGDRVLAESYLQHAEHYQRVINTFQEANPHYHHQQQQVADNVVEGEAQGGVEDLGLPASIVAGVQKQQPALEDA